MASQNREMILESQYINDLLNIKSVCTVHFPNATQPAGTAVPDDFFWNGRPFNSQYLTQPFKVWNQFILGKTVLQNAPQTVVQWIDVRRTGRTITGWNKTRENLPQEFLCLLGAMSRSQILIENDFFLIHFCW